MYKLKEGLEETYKSTMAYLCALGGADGIQRWKSRSVARHIDSKYSQILFHWLKLFMTKARRFFVR